MKSADKKTFVIVKKIVAKDLHTALKKETQATLIEIRQVVPEKDQLVSAIGFDATGDIEYDEE
jgi:hypothetical protein